MTLTEYKRKRDFRRTPEPSPKNLGKGDRFSYVIQKHDASNLHYDFRLELDGVLLSWAVPKGPCLDPTVKRLAMHVEDHPLAYGGFEGIIPQGEYGGGTVLLWDQGTWEPVADPRKGYRDGKLEFRLDGEKLRGEWKLVRTRSSKPSAKEAWLLMKVKDDAARPFAKYDVLVKQPNSVLSGRDLDAIASAKDRTWSSKAKSKPSPKMAARAREPVVKSLARTIKPIGLAGANKASMPKQIEVQLATLTQEAPSGDEWLHEIKLDGYRMICRIEGKSINFISRNHQDWTGRLKPLVRAAGDVTAKTAILDGEVVVVKSDGTTDFQALQNAFREGNVAEFQYYVFDLLYLNGFSLVELPLEERKAALAELLSALPADSALRYCEHFAGTGKAFQKQACKLHLEGSVSKRRDQPYRSGRGYDWLKVKCGRNDEFVIGGYTEPSGSRKGFGALLMGYYDRQRRLRYAGKVGTGYGDQELKALYPRLRRLEQKSSPFSDRSSRAGPTRTAHWVNPKLVAQVSYGSRTREGILRHAAYEGLREDKPAAEVSLDQALPVAQAVKKSRPANRTARNLGKRKAPTKPEADSASISDANVEVIAGVRLTSPDKVLYPGTAITKQELALYYQDVAPWLLPHLVHRPLVLVRCPEGQGKECFYQKHPGMGTPETLRRVSIRESSKTGEYVVVDDVPGLMSLAQIGVLEIHAWGSREDKLEQPDRLIFDLDPGPEVAWKVVVNSAKRIRDFLEELGLETFVKTSGGKGLHLVAPIRRKHDWDEAKAFCKAIAKLLVDAAPELFMATMSKAARTHKIFVDYLRNSRGATAVVPFSPRARANAPVSTPLSWQELTPRITADHYTVENIRRRLSSLTKDPWAGFADLRQSLSGPLNKLRSLSASSLP